MTEEGEREQLGPCGTLAQGAVGQQWGEHRVRGGGAMSPACRVGARWGHTGDS